MGRPAGVVTHSQELTAACWRGGGVMIMNDVVMKKSGFENNFVINNVEMKLLGRQISLLKT